MTTNEYQKALGRAEEVIERLYRKDDARVDVIHDLHEVNNDLWDRVMCLEKALKRIQFAGNHSQSAAIWMQKVAAHALHPTKWPDPDKQEWVDPEPMVSYGHVNDKGEGIRFRQYKKDPLPPWAVDVRDESQGEDNDGQN